MTMMLNKIKQMMQNISAERFKTISENFKGKTIAVIGDVMLDRYFWGDVSRVSPEAPVPVVDIEKETYHLGGAANVASNLKSLGVNSLLCGIIGDDNNGSVFKNIAVDYGINCDGMYVDSNRPTTVKTRIIGNNQQIVRLDIEVKKAISAPGELFILDYLNNYKGIAGIIFSDYNKGALSLTVITEIIKKAKEYNIPVFVDPKDENFFAYKDATVVKPNRKETQNALGYEFKGYDETVKAGKDLMKQLNTDNLLVTLGFGGMILFEKDGSISSVPTVARKVSDVSGAGDTAISTLAAAITGGATMKEAANLSNFASGRVCEEPGIVSITIEDLSKALSK